MKINTPGSERMQDITAGKGIMVLIGSGRVDVLKGDDTGQPRNHKDCPDETQHDVDVDGLRGVFLCWRGQKNVQM